jgi:hypothetical protein
MAVKVKETKQYNAAKVRFIGQSFRVLGKPWQKVAPMQ